MNEKENMKPLIMSDEWQHIFHARRADATHPAQPEQQDVGRLSNVT